MQDQPFLNKPERLIDAAEAVGLALTQVADEGTGRCPYPPALLAMPEHPACLDEFTAEELEAATEFLCRMGYLEYRPASEAEDRES